MINELTNLIQTNLITVLTFAFPVVVFIVYKTIIVTVKTPRKFYY